MSISERTRKLLWGRSGNRCAICRHVLVVEGDQTEGDSVVGEECHIVAQSADGPRGSTKFPSHLIDEIGNLILLCRIHHKVVDDQVSKYPAEELKRLKLAHERWVEDALQNTQSEVRILRTKAALPRTLDRITSGQQLLNLAVSSMASYHRVPENLDEELAAQIGGFLENLQDHRDLWDALGAASQIQAYRSFTKELNDFEAVGLGVFAGIEVATLQNGLKPPSRWNILHLAIQRFDEIEPVGEPVGEPGVEDGSIQMMMEACEPNGSN